MALSTYGKNLLAAAYPEKPWIQLHTGDPGTSGTSNVAGETTRKQVTLGAASAGVRKSSSAPEWTAVSTSEKYKWISVWDASTAGNFVERIQLEAEKEVSAGDNFKLAAEAFSFTES